jgi:uncharacterized membrane protein YfcA
MVVTFCGSFIQSVCGFGSAIFTMSVFPYFMPYSMCVTLTGLTALSSNVGNVLPRIKFIRWKLLIAPLIGYFCFAAYSVIFAVSKSDSKLLNILLGIVLILLSLYFIFFKDKIKIKPTFFNGLIVGALSGIMGGLFSISAPPIIVYLLSVTKDKDEYFANVMAYLMIANIYTGIFRAIKGLVTKEVLILWALGTCMTVFGVFFGKKLVDKLNAQTVRKIIYIFMAISGLMMII